jgi:riboflavin-specific deaminase-like protein
MVGVQSLWPTPPEGGVAGVVTDADLERIYAYPGNLTAPWVQVNFISSADGAVTVGGKSAGLSHPADHRVYQLGRDLSDVVLVGAGTVRAEGYSGAKANAEQAGRRARHGLAPLPPIAVVTGSADLDPESALFTDTAVPPIVITTEAAPAERRAKLVDAGAELLIAGDRKVDLPRALADLSARGLRRVNCEGGPALFAELIAEDLVDQLCLTVAPLLAGAGAGRIATGRLSSAPREMTLASILFEEGFSMMRYRRSTA